ncbi:hypothetical protein OG552_25685 [Streptomyces sp. NBC_01476]|uniref:hypothetical protein n=1 Tax=Streptomyces sp. NBC_01476 TaxID=2903881 RepID=UPI002E2F819E|nr:hypothetical protein [Streptomyces sp. NBC_01476]
MTGVPRPRTRWWARPAPPQRNYRVRRDWARWLGRQAVECVRYSWSACIELGRAQCGGVLEEEPAPGHPERMPQRTEPPLDASPR